MTEQAKPGLLVTLQGSRPKEGAKLPQAAAIELDSRKNPTNGVHAFFLTAIRVQVIFGSVEQVNNKLTIKQVRKALRSQRGSIRELADMLDVSPPAITLVLQGKLTSARILSAVTDRAMAILANRKVA